MGLPSTIRLGDGREERLRRGGYTAGKSWWGCMGGGKGGVTLLGKLSAQQSM